MAGQPPIPVGTEWLRLQNFTVFCDTEFRFVPGVNVFLGENGSGKAHARKASMRRFGSPPRG
ncbi:MAG: hypothetical protein FJX77_08445, partial [Armatimonadetes bacterium]|nr:hypothetical protein [Armatimonadota bacterium]